MKHELLYFHNDFFYGSVLHSLGGKKVLFFGVIVSVFLSIFSLSVFLTIFVCFLVTHRVDTRVMF